MRELWFVRAGTVPYGRARSLQRSLARRRSAGEIADTLLCLEHPPVYTTTRRSTPEELPMGEDWYRARGIEIEPTDRGGRTTYHGPGQLVVYPIMSLDGLGGGEGAGIGVREFVRRMERAMIAALGDHGIQAQVFDGLTGVWVGDAPPPAGDARKIGSIGLHVARGITTHGLAINVNNDLQPFEWILPCGIDAVRMTSVARELGAEQDLDGFTTSVASRLADVHGCGLAERPRDEVLGSLALETT